MYLVQVSLRDYSGTSRHPRWWGWVILRARRSLMIQQLFSWLLKMFGPCPRNKCTHGVLLKELTYLSEYAHNRDVLFYFSSIFSVFHLISLIKCIKNKVMFDFNRRPWTWFINPLHAAYVLLTMIRDKFKNIFDSFCSLPELWLNSTKQKIN